MLNLPADHDIITSHKRLGAEHVRDAVDKPLGPHFHEGHLRRGAGRGRVGEWGLCVIA